MKILQNKTMVSLIALFLMLTIAFPLAVPVNAAVIFHTSYIYIMTNATTIGVGQQLLCIAFTADVPVDIGEAAGTVPSPNRRAGWDGITFNVTHPDGKIEVIPLARTDPIGSNWFLYTPDTVGTYAFQAIFPATWKNTTANQNFYTAATSIPINVTVQQEPAPARPVAPLPTNYWERPISALYHNYYAVSGNWLGGAANQYPLGSAGGGTTGFSYSPGPGSAHILWTKPYYVGGIQDERTGDTAYMQYHYQGLSFSAIILNGVVNYVPRYTHVGSAGWEQVDLYTGQTLYLNYSDTMPSFAQIYNYDSPNQHGALTYYWRTISLGTGNGTSYEWLDGYTLNHITSVANMSGGTAVYGIDGSILRYNLVNYGNTSAPNYYMTVWNSSAMSSTLGGTLGNTGYWQWRPPAAVLAAT